MKFIFADSMDFVDPGYDFLRDRNAERRTSYWDDAYPHEIMGYAPYDGVLVSPGIVGGPAVGGKYSEAQAMRFRRVGATTFLRLDKPELAHLPIFRSAEHTSDLQSLISTSSAFFCLTQKKS